MQALDRCSGTGIGSDVMSIMLWKLRPAEVVEWTRLVMSCVHTVCMCVLHAVAGERN